MKKFPILLSVVVASLISTSVFADVKVPVGVISTTAYCSGTTTASGIRVRQGHIALSRDLIKKLGAKFGDKIYIQGFDNPFNYQDKMPNQWRCRMDIYMDRPSAVKYGLQKRMAWIERQ